MQWNGRELWVVSPQGLIALKKSRSSAIDMADIEKLQQIP
jgi:ABC-type metal ion transport system substrate-binding protein